MPGLQLKSRAEICSRFTTAGAGKTILSSKIIDHCQELVDENKDTERIGIAWQYCQIANRAQTVRGIIRNLIRQLCDSVYNNPGMRRDVLDMMRKNKDNASYDKLEDCHAILKTLANEFDKCFIIIDAFDECQTMDVESITRDSLITELGKLRARPLVTSRKDVEVPEGWSEIGVQPSEDDINVYIRGRLDGAPQKFRNLLESTPSLRNKISDETTKKYGELFQLLRLQLDKIVCLDNEGQVDVALSEAPAKMNEFYGQTVDRIREDRPKDSFQVGLQTIVWIYWAKRPLKEKELQHALAMEQMTDDNIDNISRFTQARGSIVAACKDLVVYREAEETFAFSHPTVKDYLDKAGDNGGNHHVSAHGQVAKHAKFSVSQHNSLRATLDSTQQCYARLAR
ncbi:hypothetical protein F5883DRAFT_662462 [Diaporthe sp. PMI_573]|nr:hypothetical protein F5883DRAFT_662462 [Diaporthaceae sp. PMI_573]